MLYKFSVKSKAMDHGNKFKKTARKRGDKEIKEGNFMPTFEVQGQVYKCIIYTLSVTATMRKTFAVEF